MHFRLCGDGIRGEEKVVEAHSLVWNHAAYALVEHYESEQCSFSNQS